MGAAAPYLALAAGIAAVGAAIDAAHRASIAAELGSRFGELSLSEDEINALTASVTTAFVSAADELNAQWEALNTTVAALSATDMDLSVKLMATVSAPTLSQDDIASLQAAYTDYADSVYNALGAKSGVVQLTLATGVWHGQRDRPGLGRIRERILQRPAVRGAEVCRAY